MRQCLVSLVAIGLLIIGTGCSSKADESKPTTPSTAPAGWIQHFDEASGLTLSCPPSWEFMSPDEVRAKTHGQFDVAKRTILFCVNTADFDQNVNVIFRPDVSQFASTNSQARALLEQQLPNLAESIRNTGRTLISSRVCDLAGGVALEAYAEGTREQTKMKQRVVTIIANKKYFVITFTAKGDIFDEVDKAVFGSMLAGTTIK